MAASGWRRRAADRHALTTPLPAVSAFPCSERNGCMPDEQMITHTPAVFDAGLAGGTARTFARNLAADGNTRRSTVQHAAEAERRSHGKRGFRDRRMRIGLAPASRRRFCDAMRRDPNVTHSRTRVHAGRRHVAATHALVSPFGCSGPACLLSLPTTRLDDRRMRDSLP